MRSPELTIRLFPWFAALSFTPIMIPTLVPYWHHFGLDTFDIYVLQACFAFAMVVLEVPTGMVADRIGKRTSLLAGQVIVALGALAYALGQGFGGFLVAEITLALGMALLSGADSALLYDSLKSLGREREFSAIEGRSQSFRLLTFAGCNIVGGIIAEYSIFAPMWASVVGPVLAVPVVWFFVDGQAAPVRTGWRAGLVAYGTLTRDSLRFVAKHQLVRWFILFQAVLVASASWLLWSYQPYMELTGLPVWWVGVMFAIYQLGAALFSRFAPVFVTRFGEATTLAGLAALQAGTPLLMAFVAGPAASLLVLGHQAVRGLFRPILTPRILAYTFADKRATVLSLASLAGRLAFAVTSPLVGWVGGAYDLRTALLVQGLALVAAFTVLGWQFAAVPAKYRSIKPDVG